MFARPKPPVRMLPKYWRSMADSQSRYCTHSAFLDCGDGCDTHCIAASTTAPLENIGPIASTSHILSLRAKRGNPVMKVARSAAFNPFRVGDARWIATSLSAFVHNLSRCLTLTVASFRPSPQPSPARGEGERITRQSVPSWERVRVRGKESARRSQVRFFNVRFRSFTLGWGAHNDALKLRAIRLHT